MEKKEIRDYKSELLKIAQKQKITLEYKREEKGEKEHTKFIT